MGFKKVFASDLRRKTEAGGSKKLEFGVRNLGLGESGDWLD